MQMVHSGKSEAPLTPEDRVRFRAAYDQLLRQHIGDRAASATEQLGFTRELLTQWRRGKAVVGRTYKQIKLEATATLDPSRIVKEVPPERNRLVWAVGIIIGCVGVSLFIWFLNQINVDPAPAQGNTHTKPVATAKAGGVSPIPSLTPISAPTVLSAQAVTGGLSAVPVATATMLPSLLGTSSSTSTALFTPQRLTLAGHDFRVLPTTADHWADLEQSNTAFWLTGSVVNVTFALTLPPGTNATAWHLQPGSTAVRITISSPTSIRLTDRTFTLDIVQPLSATDSTIYEPTRLGITILARESSNTRWYLHGKETVTTLGDTPTGGAMKSTLTPTLPH